VPVTAQRIAGVAVGLLLAAHLVLLGFFQLTDFDTWWHLKQGELYVTTRSLPAQDPFAFTTAGREWIKFSWVPDILFYLVYRAAGVPGLVILRLALLFAIAAALYRILRACGLHPAAAVLLVFVASLALRFRLFIRPETMSFLLLLATLAVLLRLRDGPPRTAWWLLPVQVAWTNVHASFVFGIGIPGLVLLANVVPWDRLTPGWGRLRLDGARLRHLAAAVAFLPVAGLLNPHGPAMLLFPFRQNTMTRLTAFAEWKGLWFIPQVDPIWWEALLALGMVLVAFVATALLLLVREGRFDPVGWGIVASMGVYAVLRNRAVPYFVLAILPLLALALARAADHVLAGAGPAEPEGAGEVTRRRLGAAGAAACGIVLAAAVVDQAVFTWRFPPGFGVRADLFPTAAAAFLERHRLDGRVFNAYEFGGYLLWRRWPANQVLIDGRYDAVLFDEALLEAYTAAYESPAALDRITAASGAEILVLNANPQRQRMPFIGSHPGWARVYWDKVAEVYVRRGGRHAGLIAAREYRLTRAEADLRYLAAYRADPGTWARAVAELQRAVEDNPENTWAWLGLAQEYRAAGPAALPDRLEALTRVVSLLPAQPPTGALHAERAEVLLHFGRFDEAARAARDALRLDGTLLPARWVLGDLAERRGAWAEARDQFRAILARIAPDHPSAPAVRARLDAAEQALRGAPAR